MVIYHSFLSCRHELRLPLCVLSSDPKAETRLYVTVNGFEFHVYNRTDLYARLQETFGLEPTLITPKRDEERGREDRDKTLERFEEGSQTESSSMIQHLFEISSIKVSSLIFEWEVLTFLLFNPMT